MSRAPAGDQIEFLAPNDAAFGLSDTADFVGFDGSEEPMFGDDGPRSRWLAAIATIVVAGLLGGGVIAAAPWDSDDAATPVTTTTIPPSTTVEQRTTTTQRPLTIAEVGPAGYVLDDPGAYQLAGAWTAGAEFRPSDTYADDLFDLWAAPGATRTSGRWLVASSMKSRGDYEETLPNGVRVMVGERVGVVASSSDGVSRLLFTASNDAPFEIGGFGFGLDELLAVATGISAGPDGTIDYGSLFDGPMAGLISLVSARVPNGGLNPYALMAQPRSGVYYLADDFRDTIELRVSQPTDVDAALVDFLLQPVTNLNAVDQGKLDALARDGRRFRLSMMPDSPPTLLATSMQPGDALMLDTIGTQAGDSITVVGTDVTPSSLIDMLSQVRLAGDDEWVDMIDRSNRGLLNITDTVNEKSTNIGGRIPQTDDDIPWTVELSDSDPPYVFISTQRSGWGGPLGDTPSGPTVHRYASASLTFLIATVEWPNPARTMRVTIAGSPPVDATMVQVAPAVYAAAYAFTQMLPETVEFLDEDGNLVPS